MKTQDNPADLITKTIRAEKLLSSDIWWKGPNWLPLSNTWKIENEYTLHPDVSQNETGGAESNESDNIKQIEISTFYGDVTSQQTLANSKSIYWDFGCYENCIIFFLKLKIMKDRIKNKIF